MMITVFTPAYNRAYTLPRLYGSLTRQTDNDFEWIIADDGSCDNTFDLVKNWQENEKRFDITYLRTKNGGKHRQINRAVGLAKGDGFFIVDSDDDVKDDAIESAKKGFSSIADDPEFAGVSFLCSYRNTNKIVGQKPLFAEYVDCTNFERNKYGLEGDKAEIYKTELLKQYPFPEYDKENFLTEGVLWDKLAYEGYKIRWFNRAIYHCEYLDDGLTHSGLEIFVNNPKGWGRFIHDEIQYGVNNSLMVSPLVFYLYEKDRLSDEKMKECLCFKGEEFTEMKSTFSALRERIISSGDKTFAIAGYGRYGKIIKKLFDDAGKDIAFVIDKNYEKITDMKAYPIENFPNVDMVIIAMKNPPKGYWRKIQGMRKVKEIVGIEQLLK